VHACAWACTCLAAGFEITDSNSDDDDDNFGGDGLDGPMDTDATKQEEGEEGNAATADYENGLVAEPAKVAKISINYAKVAKKVDVKALKTTIWSDLCEVPVAGSSTSKDKDKGKKETFEGERTFDSLLSSVEQKAGKEVGEVSVALCFICMLHLCNEKGLSLAQQGIEDLSICAPKT
jgi:condensin complex subunit 2